MDLRALQKEKNLSEISDFHSSGCWDIVCCSCCCQIEVECLIAWTGSLEKCLGALGGLARLDLLEEHGGGPLAIDS